MAIGVVGVKLSALPVTVTEAVPAAADPLAINVSTVVVVDIVGLNVAVTPSGRPDTVNVTGSMNPLCGTTVIVLAALPPCPMLAVAGVAISVKLGDGERLFLELDPQPDKATMNATVMLTMQNC